jgi:hypothetical protein
MKKFFLIAAFLIPALGFAQMQTGGNLTVFSEDGDAFYLVLNGEKQNDQPQTNIRIEDLPQPYYSAKIIFENKALTPISKGNLMLTDADGKLMDVTYKIKKDKSNKPKLVYYSMIEVKQDFMPPANMYVRQWGQPQPQSQYGGGIRQNNPSTQQGGGVGASVNMPGMNVNISISDPDGMGMGSSTTTHHQQTTISQHTTTNQSGGYQQPQRGCANNWPMNTGDFAAAKKTINESSFDDTKLTTAKSIVSSNCLSTDQIVQVCNSFSFEDNKLAFAKFAYKYCTDPKNYFKVNNVFSFSSNKEELSEFTQNGGQ